MIKRQTKIRIAERTDLRAIVRIYNQAIEQQKIAATEVLTEIARVSWFEEHDPEAHPILVAKQDGAVVGYLSISAYRPGRSALRHTGEVSYFVDQAHQRQGVASELFRKAACMCGDLGLKNLFAILLESNSDSIAFLEKHGFQKWAHLPRVAVFGNQEVDQVYYGKRIIESE